MLLLINGTALAILTVLAGCCGPAVSQPEPLPPPLTQPEPPEPLPISVTVIPEGKWELSGHACQTVVDTFRSLLPRDIPDQLAKYNSKKTGEEYDVNTCFSVLQHLFMEPLNILDYVYLYDSSFGGRPLVYVREIDDTPILNFEQYEEANSNDEKVENVFGFVALVIYGSDTSSNKIRIDGTPEGFFEYVVFQIMGGQFYLAWHANYDDAMIICEPAGVDKVIHELEYGHTLEEGYRIPPDFEQEARKLDFTPYIEVSGDEVTVSLVIFSKWGGFTRIDSVINREYPHKIIRIEMEKLLEYDCGITF
jgi:hypothetical protein